jgi:hypothetical protein
MYCRQPKVTGFYARLPFILKPLAVSGYEFFRYLGKCHTIRIYPMYFFTVSKKKYEGITVRRDGITT